MVCGLDVSRLCFAVDSRTALGETTQVELKKNGRLLPVTNENRQEFVRLYADWILNKQIENDFSAFKKGFLSVVGRKGELYKAQALDLFTPIDLKRLICGSDTIDWNSLKPSVKYVGFRQENDKDRGNPVICNFWKLFASLSDLMKRRLLLFVTGSDQVPIGGVKELKMVIQSGGSNMSSLPSAHTCFNTLILPEYKTYEELEGKLLKSLEYAEGFGLN